MSAELICGNSGLIERYNGWRPLDETSWDDVPAGDQDRLLKMVGYHDGQDWSDELLYALYEVWRAEQVALQVRLGYQAAAMPLDEDKSYAAMIRSSVENERKACAEVARSYKHDQATLAVNTTASAIATAIEARARASAC